MTEDDMELRDEMSDWANQIVVGARLADDGRLSPESARDLAAATDFAGHAFRQHGPRGSTTELVGLQLTVLGSRFADIARDGYEQRRQP